MTTRASLAAVAAGTSGWSYPSWRPAFYPAGTRPEDFLRIYAERLPAVELNATGYRLAPAEQFRRWAAQVPDGFRFAVKLQPRALVRPDAAQRLLALGSRLGCARVVVDSARDDGLLGALLEAAAPPIRLALDLRHPSWDGVERRLTAGGAVRVGDWEATSSWRYLRFRDPPYDEEALAAIAGRLRPLVAAGVDVFAFFRHETEPSAARYALRLLELTRS